MSRKKPKRDPVEQSPDWLGDLEEEQAWVPPDPTNLVEMRSACDFWWDDHAELSQVEGGKKLVLAEALDHFLVLTRALAQTAEGHGIDSTPLVLFLHDAEGVYYGHRPQMPTAGSPVHVLLDRLKFKLAAVLNLAPALATPDLPAPPPSVVLQGPGKPVLVRGVEKPRLTDARYRVVQALLAAGAKGLSKDELDRRSGSSDAQKVLKRLHKSDLDWQAVIQIAGKTGLGYRIV